MNISQATHLPQLTWLRGIAALFVLFSHINRANETNYSGEQPQQYFLLNWLDLGSFGVALFFTLSGCTLYLSVSQNGFPNMKSYYSFYLKRFFRIWPAFALALLAYLLAGILFQEALKPYESSWLATQFLKTYTWTDVISYLLLIFNFTGPEGLFNNAFWSLPVEFQYYLLLPLIVLVLQRWGAIAIFFVIIVSHVLYKADFQFIDSSLVFRLMFTFCLGVYSGYIYKHYHQRLPSGLAFFIILTLTIFVYLFSEGTFAHLPMPSEWLVYGIAAVGCVISSIMAPLAIPMPIARLLNFYGDISYSLYLFHNLIIAAAVIVFVQYSALLLPYKLLFLTVTSTTGATLLAWLSYKYIELPGMALGKRLLQRSRSSSVA